MSNFSKSGEDRSDSFGWKDRVPEFVEQLLDDTYKGKDAEAAYHYCKKWIGIGDLVAAVSPTAWELAFAIALEVVAPIRLGVYLISLIELAKASSIASSVVSLAEESKDITAVKKMMKEFENCSRSCVKP